MLDWHFFLRRCPGVACALLFAACADSGATPLVVNEPRLTAPAAPPPAAPPPAAPPPAAPSAVPWPSSSAEALVARVPAPAGTTRVQAAGFGGWLRRLPLLPVGAPVTAWNDALVLPGDSPTLLAVLTLDVGARDLQQCADSILRLRAEYLWGEGMVAQIAFRFTSGDLLAYPDWAAGVRPKVSGNRVSFARTAAPDASYRAFRQYEDLLFTYAGTLSLGREGALATGEVQPGDFLVRGGSPGHAVIVMDVATALDGRVFALIGEGYMPAQSFHVLRGPADGWYPVEAEGLKIPTWPDRFDWEARRRFVDG